MLDCLILLTGALVLAPPFPQGREMERVVVDASGRGFALQRTGRPFHPLGFNYDHDASGRLLEDYWETEWERVEQDFGEMSALGATVVRVHLQFGKFMQAADRPDTRTLELLKKLLDLAERQGLYLDLTGLGCYHKADVPAWYDRLDEQGRWAAQERFWQAVATSCATSPAVFCYDLMNEPVVPGGRRAEGDWLGPAFAGKHFVQFVTLDQAGRPRPEIAREWSGRLASTVRRADPGRLVTIGLVDWSLDRPGLTSGFVPDQVAPVLDFLCVHLYPERGKVEQAIETLRAFQGAGKPVVIEETFPLKCGIDEFERFVKQSAPLAGGLIGFYWGQTPEDLRPPKTIAEAMLLQWLELFPTLNREVGPG